MPTVFDLAARQVPADQALRALFETHLQHLDKDRCQDYLRAFGLPAEVTWNDAAGKTWSLWDRVRWFGMNHPQGLKSLSLFTHLFQQQPDLPWGKAPKELQRERVEAWWVVVRHRACRRDSTGEAEAVLAERLNRSLAKQPEGMPSTGLALPGDGGWLGLALDVLGEHLKAMPSGASEGWASAVTSCLSGSLLASGHGTRWWAYGKVKGALKSARWVGSPGWEEAGQLPGEPSWNGGGQSVRPKALAEQDHWPRLAARTLGLLALALERQPQFNVQESLGIEEDILEAESPGKWSSPDLVASLIALVDAGLPVSRLPVAEHLQWDGRALDALAWLHRLDPSLSEVPPPCQQRWAHFLVDGQTRWETASEPHVQALANMDFAPRQRHPQLWAWATSSLEAGARPASRLPRP